jgi:hypothetical protein
MHIAGMFRSASANCRKSYKLKNLVRASSQKPLGDFSVSDQYHP